MITRGDLGVQNPLEDVPAVQKKIKMLSEGTHAYKFLVDGSWTVDPECDNTVPNQWGTPSNVIHL